MRARRKSMLRALVVALIACGCRRGEAEADRVDEPSPPPEQRSAEPEAPEAGPAPLPPLPAHAISNDAIRAAREQAQRRFLRANEPSQPELPPLPDGWAEAWAEGPAPRANPALAPEGLPGFFTPLALPDSSKDANPLARFEAALAALESGEARDPVHLAFYGASGVSADLWTGYVRAYLQARFGDGGPGLVSAAPPTAWYRHNELKIESSKRGWTKHNSYRLQGDADPGQFGIMGQAMSSKSARAWTQISPSPHSPSAERLATYEIDYLVQPHGGSFRVLLDGELVGEVSTKLSPGDSPNAHGLGRERVELEPGAAHSLRLEIVGDGPVRLLGVIAETGQPGVVLDTLGINGGKTSNQQVWDEALWTEQLRSRDPALYVLAFGNNEAADADMVVASYEADYRAALERFDRALPEASCVLIGPDDFPRIGKHGKLHPRPQIDQIRAVQRRLASEYGCAFYDALTFFGGTGSKAAWVAAGLGKDDHLHLTRPGYLRFGMGFADSLMQGYDWRAQHRE